VGLSISLTAFLKELKYLEFDGQFQRRKEDIYFQGLPSLRMDELGSIVDVDGLSLIIQINRYVDMKRDKERTYQKQG